MEAKDTVMKGVKDLGGLYIADGLYHAEFSYRSLQDLLEAQAEITASIKDAQCQQRVERIFKEIEEKYGDKIGRIVGISKEGWQDIKRGGKEG